MNVDSDDIKTLGEKKKELDSEEYKRLVELKRELDSDEYKTLIEIKKELDEYKILVKLKNKYDKEIVELRESLRKTIERGEAFKAEHPELFNTPIEEKTKTQQTSGNTFIESIRWAIGLFSLGMFILGLIAAIEYLKLFVFQ